MMKRMKHTILFLLATALLAACGKKTEETQPTRQDVTETVFASGTLVADNTYKLTAQTSGYLTQLSFEAGDIVTEGQVLAVIQNEENEINTEGAIELLKIAEQNATPSGPLLLQAKQDILNKQDRMQQDSLQLARYKRLLQSESIARVTYEEALLSYQTSQRNYQSALANYEKVKTDAEQQVISNETNSALYGTLLGKNDIKAVVTGKVYQKLKEVGDFVRQGDVIAQIGDPDILYAQVNLDESTIEKIQVGQTATVQLNTNKEKQYTGRVKEINPSFDESSQSFICKIYFNEPLNFKIVNTQLQANITVGAYENALLIPRDYLDYSGHVQIKGDKEKTKVETKFVSNEWVQVLAGIDDQDILIRDVQTSH